MARTETWLDHMPAIPLARGVPVRFAEPGKDHGGVVIHAANLYRGEKGPSWFVACEDPSGGPRCSRAILAHRLRVDLDDPQGFAYALRFIRTRVQWFDLEDIITRWVVGETTDADRLALARALAEVA